MKLKAVLLSLVAVLAIGLTSCSDELSGDQTQGKPGYLTVNLKTLQPKQTKTPGDDATTDYKVIHNLNIFVLNSSDVVILHRYYDYTTTPITNGTSTLSIPVNDIPTGSYLVAVANQGTMTAAGLSDIVGTDISTVRDVATLGLHMTGKADIHADNFAYDSHVNIAPVESKITVKWNLQEDVTNNFTVTGIYIVNAIDHTKLPLIRNRAYSASWATNAEDIAPSSYINYTGNTTGTLRSASRGFAMPTTGHTDFDYYATMTDATALLSDEGTLSGSYHYYVGENYSDNTSITTLGGGSSIALNAAGHANTLVLVKVTPTTAGASIYGNDVRYYTYEFNKTNVTTTNDPVTGITEGFSVKRKTNYTLTFNLASVGSTEPFRRSKTLSVTVTADPWEPATVNF